jgi:hypothetical protein
MTQLPGVDRLDVGAVVVVRTGGWAAAAIRFGAALLGRPNLSNHVAVMHHWDSHGVPWGVEGRPGGVGWVDLRGYLNSRWTLTNRDQPIESPVRTLIARTVESMLGVEYDWGGILADTEAAAHLPVLFAQNWHGRGAPGHCVCSSLAAYAYKHAGLPHPASGRERFATPGDWAQWCLTGEWHAPVVA